MGRGVCDAAGLTVGLPVLRRTGGRGADLRRADRALHHAPQDGAHRRPRKHTAHIRRRQTSVSVVRVGDAAGSLSGCLCSGGLVAAVLIYGELTALFITRHKTERTAGHANILHIFGGDRLVTGSNRTQHMDALVEDSIAFAVASFAIMACQLTAAACAVTLANWAAGRMITRLRWKLLRSVLSQETGFFDTNTTMNFASTLTEDTEKLKMGVGEHVAMASYLGGSVLVASSVALAHGWQLTLSGLAVVPLALFVAATVAKNLTRCSAAEVVAYGAAGRIVEQALSAVRTVRAYAGEQVEVNNYSCALTGASAAARRRCAWAGAGAGLGWLLTYGLNAIVFAYGAALCVDDMPLPPEERTYHPGIMVTVLFCTFMAAQNIAMLNPHLEIFSTARGAAKSLFHLLERESKINALQDSGVKPEAFKGDIVFDNLYFNYPSRPDVKVLRGLSLRVHAGETVALVGGSGCGKSTLLQLLQRAYEPDSGAVAVDGHRLHALHLHNFRRKIGVVGQEPVLFSGTIRENIMMGVDDATEADMIEAAKTAHAHQFITKLADGYNTTLGERGAQLSGGQKQRVAIARALLRKPAILLLDEPTSALDPAAERQVQAALDAASKGRTTLVVSHRLSTIVNASRIVYIEQGAVLEQGTHLELLEKKGAYWKLLQDDMTHRSIAAAQSESSEDEVVDAQADNKLQRVRRNSSICSTHRESFRRDRFVRGSLRLGSMSTNQLASAPSVFEEDESEVEEEEKEADVSSWQLLKLNSEEWPMLAGGGAASLLIGATMPVFALLFSKLYGMFSWPDHDEILRYSQIYAGMFACAAFVSGMVTFLQAYLFGLAGAKLTDRLRILTFKNYLVQEQGWFDVPTNSVGALCARLASDCAAVQGATGTRLGTMLQGVSTMVLGVSLAMAFSWKMTLVSLLSVPCVIGGICLEGWVTKKSEVKEQRALESASRLATEAVLNVRTVHSLGVEWAILHRYQLALQEAEQHVRRSRWVRGPVYGLCLCAPTLGYAVSLAYGGYLIAREDLNYEYAILVSEALIYGAWMLAEALSFAPNFAAARRSGARIIRALARRPAVVTENSAVDDPTWKATGKLAFSNIHFHYPTRPNVPVLRGLDLELPAGKTLALVGPSGCGKSTIMHLLMRSYDPNQGVVRIDGRDARRDLPLGRLRAQLGLVQQEPVMFERSIRDNIAYGDTARDVPLDEIIAAAKMANVHSFVATLPSGYDTVLEAGSAALSGGQKQRVAIARALLRNPRVLLLDEATSALDAASEKVVQAALETAAKDRTTVIIAHRLATVRHADVISVVDKGVIAESGSHEELVRKRGLYWELLQQQGPTEMNS
ncbi:multidrug resistance protein homolog 49 [Bicyclus anynana]|uniref:Multidrug resistance protein homolog 49 n=1 Tax=Bicyclus anynana TaxID=110368 RepID=A0ABM3LIB2_BICAN|nr:multidrug resistance protein homolog 49 [Bicyclus anynana]